MGAQMYMRAAYCCKTATTTMRVPSVASIGSEAKLLVDWSAVVKGWHIALPTFNTHSLSHSYTVTQTNTHTEETKFNANARVLTANSFRSHQPCV